MSDKIIKGFKGFNKDMTCRGFQFQIGKEYEHNGEISACRTGFHLCKNPLDVLKYYGPATSEYCEVEGSGKTQGHKEDSKFCVSKLTIAAKISLKAIITLGVKMFISEAKEKAKPTSGDSSPSATSGDSSPSATSGNSSPSATSGNSSPSATSGDSSPSATSGYSSHSATSGYSSHSATSGNSSHSATSGYYSPSATSGDSSPSATSGDSSHSATSGDSSPSATSGDSSHSATSGNSSHSETKGKNSIACAIGRNSKARSTIGNWIVVSEYDNNGNVLEVATAKVDDDKIKADTWYILKGGKFTEAE